MRPLAVAPCPLDPDRLFRDHALRVGRWAARLSGSASEADDIVQEVFMTVLRHPPAGEALQQPLAWLLGITRNVVRHVWRSRQRAEARFERCDLDELVAPEPDPHHALERHEATQRLHAALRALDAGHRQVCWLSDVEELPPARVEALTGLRPATLRVRRFRARRRLAEILTRDRAA
jgi:RNA polymerase sigma-70 factor (ECF subfamily)